MPSPTTPLPVTIGVFAHNEERSVADSLACLRRSRTRAVEIAQVIFVSASTDATDARALEAARDWPEFELLREERAEGKPAAVNRFLARARHGVCVLMSADFLLHPDAIEALCSPFLDPRIGIVGGRPVPIGTGAFGFAARAFWDLHHRLCLRAPKMGELVAFRKVVASIPIGEAGADEDWLHGEVLRLGFRASYAPEARLYNRMPATVRDYLAHRHRLAVQHLVLRERASFSPSSRKAAPLIAAALSYLRDHPTHLPGFAVMALAEVVMRLWARVSYARGVTCWRWAPLRSSRGLTRAEALAGMSASERHGELSTTGLAIAWGAREAEA